MLSLKKISKLPITGLATTCIKQCKIAGVEGCVHLHAAVVEVIPLPEESQSRNIPANRNIETATSTEQIVQLPSPMALKLIGIENYFVQTRGSELIVCAATKKLLEEEKLRQSLQILPLDSIVKEHWRCKPSTLRPVCPLTHEEL